MTPVKTLTRTNQALHRLRGLMKTVHDEISQRAFQLFREKGCKPGYELQDWMEAERQVLCCPPAELTETKDEIHIRAAVPGFHVHTLQVDVLPDSITIEGERPARETPDAEKIHYSEFGEIRLLRQFALPARISPDDVEATLDEGVLCVVAKKEAAAVSPIYAEINSRRTAA